jgi:centromeric protein E
MGSNPAQIMAGGAGGSPPTPLPLILGNGNGEQAPVDDDDSTGEYGDGMASLAAQVRALQADLADKNRYIATLEKRLLQARRSSHSRVSLAFSPTHRLLESEGDVAALVAEKDTEIADLRARLDDKDHMITALRSAARKRDVADTATDRPLAGVMADRGEAVRQW